MLDFSTARTQLVWTLALTMVIGDFASQASAAGPSAPGLHEVVVYSPGTHERELPGIRFEPVERGNGPRFRPPYTSTATTIVATGKSPCVLFPIQTGKGGFGIDPTTPKE